MVVPVVEADLADGEKLRTTSEFFQARIGVFRREPCLVGMDSGGSENPVVLLRVYKCGIEVVRALAIADGEQCGDSGFLSPEEHLATVVLELIAVDVSVRVDEHYFS